MSSDMAGGSICLMNVCFCLFFFTLWYEKQPLPKTGEGLGHRRRSLKGQFTEELHLYEPSFLLAAQPADRKPDVETLESRLHVGKQTERNENKGKGTCVTSLPGRGKLGF